MSVSYNGLWKLLNEQGIMAKTMAYLNKLYVDTPVGADIFKVAGGGQNYVHGGTSLQEMMVPVIELTTNTRGVAYDYVDVVLTSITRNVTNLITYFDFIQTEKVTDTMKARSLLWNQENISMETSIILCWQMQMMRRIRSVSLHALILILLYHSLEN